MNFRLEEAYSKSRYRELILEAERERMVRRLQRRARAATVPR